MSHIEGVRRDPQRLFSPQQRAHIANQQHHVCKLCDTDLPDVFHVHHIVPWADGGSTVEENGIAVCPDCHRIAPVREFPVFEPREWQKDALPRVLTKLRGGQFATVNAAPGAGKTLFGAWIYRQLAASQDVTRVVVFVPNANLRTQWADSAKLLNVYLGTKGTTERRTYDGVVLTYHALSDSKQVEQIIMDAEDQPTLFILDEVHHLAKDKDGDAGSWAVNVSRIVGNYDQPHHRVLNLSGTLFRSKRSERISTIEYQSLPTGQIETVADYNKHAGSLIEEGHLRHVKVLGYDAEMKVEAIDLHGVVSEDTVRAVDLDDSGRRPRSPILAGMVRDSRFLDGILDETVLRLGHSSIALEGAPVKGLVIADGVEHAEQVHDLLTSKIGMRHAFIAHGKLASAEAEIQRFRASRGQAVMVAVQKVSEGFDVPDICVLTYLRTWTAELFINQMVGRAMRVTDRERELGTTLPATVLVPNDAAIKEPFARVLDGSMKIFDAPSEPCLRCGREVCGCLPRPKPKDKICSRCNMPWKICVCTCDECGRTKATGCRCGFRPPGDEDAGPMVTVIGDGEVVHVSVDGHEVDLHLLNALRGSLSSTGTPDVYMEQVVSSVQQAMRTDPMAFLASLKEEN